MAVEISVAEVVNDPGTVDWHALAVEEVLARVKATPRGLDASEAQRRLRACGPNQLREAAPVPPWRLFLAQFQSILVGLLVVAGVVALLLGEWIDAVAILAIVFVNALIGFAQERRAERAIGALRQLTAPRARVRRDGKALVVPASELVPGDLVLLDAGDLVPADLRLVQAASLRCVEAALTGESEPVGKDAAPVADARAALGDRTSMVFGGTSVVAGSAEAVAVATGMNTEMGRIARLMEEAASDDGTPLQQRLAAFGRLLVWGAGGIVALLFLLGVLRGEPVAEMLLSAISLAVAAVPEGLPAVVTIALAVGVMRMARRQALVRRLAAVETLGSANVICTDKTGTLTVGQMTVRSLDVAGRSFAVTGEGYGPNGAVMRVDEAEPDDEDRRLLAELAAVLVGCNDAHLRTLGDRWEVVGDPTEGALLAAGLKLGVGRDGLDAEEPRLHAWPFDSDRKRMSVLRQRPAGDVRLLVKGAPEVVLERCTAMLTRDGIRPITDADRASLVARQQELTARALRVLAAAHKTDDASVARGEADVVERGLVFVGLVGMYDPPRPEVLAATAKCRSAGIRVVMITGDHPQTARAVAAELGIAQPDDPVLTGPELQALDENGLAEAVERTTVYARVTAEHKLRIVRAWQARGAVVAMTGDGVNDAPALRGADIGIAMGQTGTEVTKAAADMVIADDNFASIVAAVEEGRGIYANIRKTLLYLLAGNCGELLLITACVVGGLPMPLLPIHLLWINLVTDGLPALCLATDPIDADVMQAPPRARTERLTDRAFLTSLLLTGTLTAALAMAVFLYGLAYEDTATARTHAFAALVFAELLRAFSSRSETGSVFAVGIFSNLRLAFVVAATFTVQIASHHVDVLRTLLRTERLPWSECVALIALSTLPVAVLEAWKAWRRRV